MAAAATSLSIWMISPFLSSSFLTSLGRSVNEKLTTKCHSLFAACTCAHLLAWHSCTWRFARHLITRQKAPGRMCLFPQPASQWSSLLTHLSDLGFWRRWMKTRLGEGGQFGGASQLSPRQLMAMTVEANGSNFTTWKLFSYIICMCAIIHLCIMCMYN